MQKIKYASMDIISIGLLMPVWFCALIDRDEPSRGEDEPDESGVEQDASKVDCTGCFFTDTLHYHTYRTLLTLIMGR